MASAKPTKAQDRQAAVLEFSGAKASSVRQIVAQFLNERVLIVPISDVEDSADRHGVNLDRNDGLHPVAFELKLRFFVRGSVDGYGDATTTELTFVDGDGEILVQGSIEGSVIGRTGKERVEILTEKLYAEAIEILENGRPNQKKKKKRVGPRSVNAVIGDGSFRRDGDLPVLIAFFGVGTRNRSAELELQSGLLRTYTAGFFPELSLRFEARPYGQTDDAIRGLWFLGEIATSVGVESQDDFNRSFDTSTFRFNVDAGYLFSLDRLDLGAAIGVGYDVFSVDENLVLVGTQYSYLRIGLETAFRIVPQYLYAKANGGFRLALGVGDVVDVHAERASSFGYDFGAALGGAFADLGIAYAVRFQYIGYQTDFAGTAPIVADTGKGMTDGAMILTLNVGYQIWSFIQ
ncbi:MAG: hypothetical protein KC416_07255 [Myxococcales bacterium]|nr:hypothetical protein [Myxococcales bacterium]